MGKRGPAKTPTAVLRLHGSKRAKYDRRGEPVPAGGAPSPPDWLKGRALEEWQRAAPLLAAQGTLAKVDLAVMTGYCVAWAVMAEAAEAIDRFGLTMVADGTLAANPACAALNNAMSQLQRFAAKLGLSAADRASISVPPAEGPDATRKFLFGH